MGARDGKYVEFDCIELLRERERRETVRTLHLPQRLRLRAGGSIQTWSFFSQGKVKLKRFISKSV